MFPTPAQALKDTTNSINAIVLHLNRTLPQFGYELTEDAGEASLVAGHAGQTYGQGLVDVGHMHGLYPTYHFNEIDWHFAANQSVIRNLRQAKEITVPSEWVADILRRDMHIEPHVVGWAINPKEWTLWDDPDAHKGYILWNKTRPDGVCNPEPMIQLAKRLPEQQFVATFGEDLFNLKVIGRQPYEKMRDIIHGAEIYLSTTKETFGIGTLEAMACGVPVLGFDHGGNSDIIHHGVTGYLVQPGDIDGLVAGVAYIKKHRRVMGLNAHKMALGYTWDKVAKTFASIYSQALNPHTGPKVSVIIPCHNYEEYVQEAIQSIIAQETAFDFELIVVENGSTDGSRDVITTTLDNARPNPHFSAHLMTFGEGLGPAKARNIGISYATGEYIVCLDADDKVGAKDFLQLLADALDKDPELGIAYTRLRLINETETLTRDSQWPHDFDFKAQTNRDNQIPTCCMYRKFLWERAGGYRSYLEPAEDAELWLRMTALGYHARMVTTAPLFLYRWHDRSLSHPVRIQHEHNPRWNKLHGWAWGQNIPFAAPGNPPKGSWPVRNYDQPLITVIIPCGKGHLPYLPDALDSVWGQSEWRWECVVVNDTGTKKGFEDIQQRYPWVRIIKSKGRKPKGAGHARNLGIQWAKTDLIAFLDADDMWEADFLRETLLAYQKTGKYAYTDWMVLTEDGQVTFHKCPEYTPGEVFVQTSIHSICILMERKKALEVGGFDEEMDTWEDVDFFMKLATINYCGVRVPKYAMSYRHLTGNLREHGETKKQAVKDFLYNRYKDYMENPKMCGCNNNPKVKMMGQVASAHVASAQSAEEAVRVLYDGFAVPGGAHDVFGQVTNKYYGRRRKGDVFYVLVKDYEGMQSVFSQLADVEREIVPTPMPQEPSLL